MNFTWSQPESDKAVMSLSASNGSCFVTSTATLGHSGILGGNLHGLLEMLTFPLLYFICIHLYFFCHWLVYVANCFILFPPQWWCCRLVSILYTHTQINLTYVGLCSYNICTMPIHGHTRRIDECVHLIGRNWCKEPENGFSLLGVEAKLNRALMAKAVGIRKLQILSHLYGHYNGLSGGRDLCYCVPFVLVHQEPS